MRAEAAVFAKQEMIRLCHSGLDSRSLRLELLKRLQTVIPFDYVYFSTTDPATQLGTSTVMTKEPPAWLMSIFLDNEFRQQDFNKFSDMLRTQQPVAILSEAAGPELHRSHRYREMLHPLAMEDELRAVLVADAACWGTLCLHRQRSKSNYTAAEADILAQLGTHFADGLRKATLLNRVSPENTPDGPGVLILADNLTTVAITAAAEFWLTELVEMERDRHGLSLAVRSVVASLRGIESGMVANRMPRIRLQTRSGQWLVLHASRLNSADGHGQIAVIFEAAQPAEIAPLIMQAYQLTKREGEITQCILRGWSTTEISARLHISANTVQDHLKSIFEKVNVNSRGELAARFFTQQQL